MNEIKNILLIGKTGAGKSTLGNLLVNKDVFKTSAGSISETKNYQAEEVKIDGIEYRVIDTIGLGDTNLLEGEVLFKLANAIRNYLKDDGVNQILFVIDGRFTQAELENLARLEIVMFDKKIANYTTIVRTSFPDFENRDDCDRDIQKIKDENPELKSLINSVSVSSIVHSDAPEKNYEGWEEDWQKANKHLWDYLKTKKEEKYMPEGIERLNKKIEEYLEKNNVEQAAARKKIEELKEEIEKEKKQQEEALRLKREAQERAEAERERAEKEQKKAEDEHKRAEEARKEAEKEREKSEKALRLQEEALKEKKIAQGLVEEGRRKLELAKENERLARKREEDERKRAEAARKEVEKAEKNERLERERGLQREEAFKKSQRESQKRINELEKGAIKDATSNPKAYAFEALEKYGESSLKFVEGGIDAGGKAIPLAGIGSFVGGAIATVIAAGVAVVGVPIAVLKSLV